MRLNGKTISLYIFEWYNSLRETLQELFAWGQKFLKQYFFLFVLQNVISRWGNLSISFAAVRLLWTVVSQSFMTQWNFDECYKWSVKESIMSGFDWTDFGEGHVEQCLCWKMTGNSRMTSVMAQCKTCLMKWRNQWASITPFKTWSTPQDSSCELKKDIFHATT